jgi:hypothetical protein
MPNRSTVEAAKKDLREGKSASTAAGEFVREEIEHVREGKHGASSPQQAIAIGLSKARRAGVPLEPPAPGKTSEAARKRSKQDYEKGQSEPKTREQGVYDTWSSPSRCLKTRAEKHGISQYLIAAGQASCSPAGPDCS